MAYRFDDYSFERFVDETEAVATDTALFGALDRATGHLGYERVYFSVLADPKLPPSIHQNGLHIRDLEQWSDFYTQNYARIDPVLRAIRAGAGTFAWDTLPQRMALSAAQNTFLGQMKDIGLHHGVAIGLGYGNAAIGVSTGDAQTVPHANLALLAAIGTQFYRSFRRLHSYRTSSDTEPLTPAERDVLAWLGAGKTDEEIGMILSIRSSTVDSHLRSIFRKLDASNRVTAVLNGIRAGYLSL